MKFHFTAVSAVLYMAGSAASFTSLNSGAAFAVKSASSPAANDSRLFMAGIEGGRRKKEEAANPEEKVSTYVKPPESLEPRANLEGKALVSGYVNDKDRADQQVFDILNNHDGVSAFDFETIVAFCDDASFAKKRLLSRSSRYNGLLDKLEVVQASSPGALPSTSELNGVSCWVAQIDATKVNDVVGTLGQMTMMAQASGVANLAVMVTNSQMIESATASSIRDRVTDGVTISFVGALDDKKKEGSHPYRIINVEDVKEETNKITSDKPFSREEAVRISTEALGLQSASKRTVSLTSNMTTNSTAAVLIKGLRGAGYSRCQEINEIFGSGVENYEEAIAKYKQEKWEKENPDPELLAAEKKKQDEEMKIERERIRKEMEEEKKNEIEELATEWAKREYFRKSLGGNMAMSEDEYIKSVWERAMFEGDLKWRMTHGRDTDERKELAAFLSEQEKKKEVALKRAQEALAKQGLPKNDGSIE